MRFKSWSDKRIWLILFESVVENPDMESVMIDTTIIRANACFTAYKKNSQTRVVLVQKFMQQLMLSVIH